MYNECQRILSDFTEYLNPEMKTTSSDLTPLTPEFERDLILLSAHTQR